MKNEINYTILLPPSEGKKSGGDENKPYRFVQNIKSSNSFINLSTQREEIYGKLRESIAEVGFENLQKIFELKGDKLKNAIAITSDLLNEETLSTINRYSGVMFKAIDYDDMNEKSKLNFDNSVVFVDGMFGLLRPKDLIPEYKLKITSKFLDIDVTKFWRENLKGIFVGVFRGKLVIDILSEAHRKVVDFEGCDKYFRIKFCEIKNKKLVNVGHESKVLKGEFVNYLVSFDRLNEEKLIQFKHSSGFKYSKKYSNVNEIIYLR